MDPVAGAGSHCLCRLQHVSATPPTNTRNIFHKEENWHDLLYQFNIQSNKTVSDIMILADSLDGEALTWWATRKQFKLASL
jgi:hypothetical protein